MGEAPCSSDVNEAVVFQKAYHRCVWYAERTERFPKAYRHTLADRIQKINGSCESQADPNRVAGCEPKAACGHIPVPQPSVVVAWRYVQIWTPGK